MKRTFLGSIGLILSVLLYKPTLAQEPLQEATEMLESVNAVEVENTMKFFSRFRTRYHRSPEAIKAQEWLKSHWEEITQNRDDVHIELFEHPEISPMPSVILTIEGSSFPEEIIVLGAHADSVITLPREEIERILEEETKKLREEEGQKEEEEENRIVTSRTRAILGNMNLTATAPGADDNASGIAVITEILRILMLHNYRPTRTIMFMAYAAEEVGFIGSGHIAESFEEEGQKVIGVLNLDMTNFRGSEDLDMVIVGDYTSPGQNAFLEELIQIYLPEIKWEYDECEYECSDHVSWHNAGFPVSMLFESRFSEYNPHLHKTTDTFENSGGNAEHSVDFAKLALVFTTEIDRFGVCRYDQEQCN